MRRRDLLTLLGGAVAAGTLPLPLGAQQAMAVVGYLQTGTLREANSGDLAAFCNGLGSTGFVTDQNVRIEFRAAQDRLDRLPALAKELVDARVDAIFTLGGVAPAMAAKNATSTTPIVFTHGSDPVKTGLVGSLNRPGGNVTGVSIFSGQITAKRLELLRELVPKAVVIAVLVNPKSATGEERIADVETAARSFGLKLFRLNVTSPNEFETAFATLDRERADALFVINDPLFRTYQEKVLEIASRLRIPAMHADRDIVAVGGLMSYGADIRDVIRKAGVYVGRILKGERPADLPVLLPTKFTLAINLKTAKALGLTVPLTLQASADEVIE